MVCVRGRLDGFTVVCSIRVTHIGKAVALGVASHRIALRMDMRPTRASLRRPTCPQLAWVEAPRILHVVVPFAGIQY